MKWVRRATGVLLVVSGFVGWRTSDWKELGTWGLCLGVYLLVRSIGAYERTTAENRDRQPTDDHQHVDAVQRRP